MFTLLSTYSAFHEYDKDDIEILASDRFQKCYTRMQMDKTKRAVSEGTFTLLPYLYTFRPTLNKTTATARLKNTTSKTLRSLRPVILSNRYIVSDGLSILRITLLRDFSYLPATPIFFRTHILIHFSIINHISHCLT